MFDKLFYNSIFINLKGIFNMDGKSIRKYWSNEVDSILDTYKQFEILIPNKSDRGGSAHNAEDGRFVEELLRECLQKFLPKGLEVLTGFILRPAVKTGENGRERKNSRDSFSSQLDIIIFDSINYPVFQRLGNTAILPPEGVVSVISVKKHLRDKDIETEISKLLEVAQLCDCYSSRDNQVKSRKPYLGLIAIKSEIKKSLTDEIEWVFKKISEFYKEPEISKNLDFNSCIGLIGTFQDWCIFKKRPLPKEEPKEASYVGLYKKDEENHMLLQFILTGILSVFYDETRRNLRRPGYTAFESNRVHDKNLGSIPVTGL